MQKVLLIENNVFLLTTLVKYLRKFNVKISSAKSLKDAFFLLEKNGYDLVISDRVLDDGDGLKVIDYLHNNQFKTRTLLLTQKNSSAERIEGLRSGADDYLGKPFSLEEFSLRVKSLLGKQKKFQHDFIKYGKICLFPNLGEIELNGKIIKLTPKETNLLECLLRYKNRTVPRETLIREVWGEKKFVPYFKTVDVYIRRIRVKMGKDGKLISTKHGFGYIVLEEV